MRLQILVVVDCVIHTPLLPLELGQDSIKPTIIPISRRQEALRAKCVPPTTEWCDKRGEVPV